MDAPTHSSGLQTPASSPAVDELTPFEVHASAEMERLVLTDDVAYVHLAFVYAALGDHAHALDCLERADARHEADVNFISVDLAFDRLSREPRFTALLDRLGLDRQ